jgi:type II secretory pathway pseudopilin PulG
MKESKMLIKRVMPRSLRGFTLTEAAIVLGIVGLILGAIWVAAAAVYNNLRVTTGSNQLLQITQSIRSIHATSQTVDSALDVNAVARTGGVPKDMMDDPNDPSTFINGWGGSLTIDPATINGAADTGFTITFTGVPQGPCSDMLVRNTGSGRDSGLFEAGVTGTMLGTNDFPIGITNAVDTCSDPTDNDVAFTFRLKS